MAARTETIRCVTALHPVIQQGDNRIAGPMIRQYAMALSFVAAALLASLALQPLFPHPFLFLFFAGVVAAAWFGGMLPGLFAVLISTFAVDYFFVPPLYSFAVKPTELSYFAAFVISSLLASWVSASKKQSEEELKQARSQLQILVADRTAALQQSTSELQENERHIRLLTEVISQPAPGASAMHARNSRPRHDRTGTRGSPGLHEFVAQERLLLRICPGK